MASPRLPAKDRGVGEGCRCLRSQGNRAMSEDPSPPLFQKTGCSGAAGSQPHETTRKLRPHRFRESPLAEKGFPGSPLHPPQAGGTGPLQEVAWTGTGLLL